METKNIAYPLLDEIRLSIKGIDYRRILLKHPDINALNAELEDMIKSTRVDYVRKAIADAVNESDERLKNVSYISIYGKTIGIVPGEKLEMCELTKESIQTYLS